MRSILVHAEQTPAGQARVDTALSLARMTGGHVTLLVDTPIMRFTSVDGLGGAMVATDALQEAVQRDDTYARELDARLASEDVPTNVLRAETEPVDALANAARLSDVVVVSRADPVAGDLPLNARCAVLALNDDTELVFPLERACIAWDGGAEAAAALRASAGLLAGCSEVAVLTVEDAPASWPATDAVEYLSRHGIEAEQVTLPRLGTIEETLARELQVRQGQLLVMGAFGHSRVREFLFGGVTRSFLEFEGGPALLLAH